jgi:hypothetical protein
VEIDPISPDAANRLTNSLMGAANGRGQGAEPLRIETIYDAERARMKIILVGGHECGVFQTHQRGSGILEGC